MINRRVQSRWPRFTRARADDALDRSGINRNDCERASKEDQRERATRFNRRIIIRPMYFTMTVTLRIAPSGFIHVRFPHERSRLRNGVTQQPLQTIRTGGMKRHPEDYNASRPLSFKDKHPSFDQWLRRHGALTRVTRTRDRYSSRPSKPILSRSSFAFPKCQRTSRDRESPRIPWKSLRAI